MSDSLSTSGERPAVEIEGVSKRFLTPTARDKQVLDRIDLTVDTAEFVTILGPSGCGKSTLLRMVAGLEAPSCGTIRVAGLTPEQARSQHLYAMAFQQPGLLEWRDVQANIALPLELAGLARPERERRVSDLLELVGLDGIGAYKVWELSGGMQQRVALARALAVRPRLLLLDEPFAALDELTRERLQGELLAIQRETAVAVMMVTHSVREAVRLGSRTVVMGANPGRVVSVFVNDHDRDDDRDDDRDHDRDVGSEFEMMVERARSALTEGG